jgi:hypothetical protein
LTNGFINLSPKVNKSVALKIVNQYQPIFISAIALLYSSTKHIDIALPDNTAKGLVLAAFWAFWQPSGVSGSCCLP